MENVFKVIHWKCVKHESQLITQLIKLQFWGLSIAQKVWELIYLDSSCPN